VARRNVPDREEIRYAAGVLRDGGLVAFPTETVYGLGADASNPAAVRRVFAVKGRPSDHPVIVHVASAREAERWAAGFPPLARKLARAFWPGPLTMILRSAGRACPEATGGLPTVGLRVPDHPVALALLRAFGGGIAAPSANRYGSVSPTEASHVWDDLGLDVDAILDGGPCGVGVESTIVDLASAEPAILRPGGVPREAIERVAGCTVPVRKSGAVRAPGTHARHYAPKRARLEVVPAAAMAPRARELRAAGKTVVVLTAGPSRVPAGVRVEPLGRTPAAAARRLYRAIRAADAAGADVILVSLPVETGLGLALADRLRRASSRARR
jgi:L-threonylcarbamoyladenylate synthase